MTTEGNRFDPQEGAPGGLGASVVNPSRIVLATGGSLGDLHPYLAIGLGLKARGHRVAVATLDFYRARVESPGLEFLPIRPRLSPEDPELVKLAVDVKTGSENIFRRFITPYLRESYEDTLRAIGGADLLLTHPTTIAAPLAAEKSGVPWASAVLAPLSFLSVHEPAEFPGYPALSALTRAGTWMRRLVAALGRMKTRPWVGAVDDLRAELGLPPAGHPLFEGQHSPRLVLALFSKVLGRPQPDWPANAVVTGFCLHDRKEGRETIRPDLARFLDAGPPPVVFTLGSSAVFDAGAFWEESAAVGRRAVLVGAPARFAGPGTFAVDYVPYSQLFPRAAAVVCTGGAGTLGQALRAGRPILAVPCGNDQPDNVARVRRLGVARSVPRARYDRRRVTGELGALLGDPSYGERAALVAKEMSSEDGVRTACDALEGLL